MVVDYTPGTAVAITDTNPMPYQISVPVSSPIPITEPSAEFSFDSISTPEAPSKVAIHVALALCHN